jgi:hypothetical protein
MKNLSATAQLYILGTIVAGCALMAWAVLHLDWSNPGVYVLAVLGATAQTFKQQGPNARTNYSLAWFIYGLAFVTSGPVAAILVVVVAHLVEWIWHKYPWYIQSFNVGAHALPLYLAGLLFGIVSRGEALQPLGLAVANLVFVVGNHFMVGEVVKLARGQSFAESGVFAFLTLFLDYAVLSLGAVTILVWQASPYAVLLSSLPLYLLHNGMPALMRQVAEMKK